MDELIAGRRASLGGRRPRAQVGGEHLFENAITGEFVT
jgi:hypothetical protein